ncbi:hypothetical protein N7470_004566 [Penicillium chermesinum]|nr:hypothetical protein N7470_004566 [Penicillium chermesinum]
MSGNTENPESVRPRLPNFPDHALIGDAAKIPVNSPTAVVSVSPIIIPAPERIIDLHVRVSAPVTGNNLPIVLLSHGQGMSNNLSSLNGYAPVANFWAARGFVVIQPNHLSSKSLSLGPDVSPDAPLHYRSRVMDMKKILDNLDVIEAALPQLKGRLDHSRIAVAGHSMGGHTASMLLGARLTDPISGSELNLTEPRIKAGVLLAAPGDGRNGEGLSDYAKTHMRFFLTHSHAEMATPALVVIGEEDGKQKGPKSLLRVVGGGHGLGDVSGYDTAEATDDESPERLSMVLRLTWAYLWSQLYPEDHAWSAAVDALKQLPHLGKVESK